MGKVADQLTRSKVEVCLTFWLRLHGKPEGGAEGSRTICLTRGYDECYIGY